MKPYIVILSSLALLCSCGGDSSSSTESSSSAAASSSAPVSSAQGSSSATEDPSYVLVREALDRFSARGFSTKGYDVAFDESFAATTNNETEDETTSFTLQYSCQGQKKVTYALNEEYPDQCIYDPLEILTEGEGGYYLYQNENFQYINTTVDKSSGITTSDKTEVRQSHKLSVSFDESTFSASTEEFYNATSTGRAAQGYAHQYAGSIEKGVLLENLSDGLVENTLAMLKFADATNYVDQAEAHFLEMMPMIANLDEESLNEFIRTYDVQASEVEEGIQISLTYSIADLLDEDEEEAGTVPADLLFDSEGDLLGFSYVFSDLISGLADEDAEIDEESTSFVVTGCLLHSTLDPIYVASGDEYTDPVQFINVFKDQALPRLFD